MLNSDFVKPAERVGLAGMRAKDADELRLALREALSNDHPTLIEVSLGEVPSMWALRL